MKAKIVLLMIVLFLAACSGNMDAQPPADSPVGGETQQVEALPQGQALLEKRCTSSCHGLEKIEPLDQTADEWQLTVNRMVDMGAKLNSDEMTPLVQYLAENY